MTNLSEWMRKKRNGYFKINLAVDKRKKRGVSPKVSQEATHDSEKLVPLVSKAQRKTKVAEAVADGSYDSKENFDFL